MSFATTKTTTPAASGPHFLANKVAIVTGGSGTIGKAIAEALVSKGARVVITGRNSDTLQKAQVDLQSSNDSNSGSVTSFAGDVSKEDDVLRLFETVASDLGGCDLLVNNAGTNVPGATVNLSAEEFTSVLHTNVVGPFLCSREALKQMKAQGGGGRIINVGSISAHSPRPDSAPYTTSKFALHGLTQSLSIDARQDGIAVGIIQPGNVVSNLLTPEMIQQRSETEGWITPQQVAECVLQMASLPYTANVLEMTVLPTRMPFVGRG